ncbi:MAG: hypothetical protein ACR2NU_16565 [Aeoliella sp.]
MIARFQQFCDLTEMMSFTLPRITQSFRLNRSSIRELFDSWPIFVVSVCICVGLAYAGWWNVVWRLALILFGVIYFGCVIQGTLEERLREQYPNARYIVLFTIGLVVAAAGVICRMAFPANQGGFVDNAWILISFVTILFLQSSTETISTCSTKSADIVR